MNFCLNANWPHCKQPFHTHLRDYGHISICFRKSIAGIVQQTAIVIGQTKGVHCVIVGFSKILEIPYAHTVCFVTLRYTKNRPKTYLDQCCPTVWSHSRRDRVALAHATDPAHAAVHVEWHPATVCRIQKEIRPTVRLDCVDSLCSIHTPLTRDT